MVLAGGKPSVINFGERLNDYQLSSTTLSMLIDGSMLLDSGDTAGKS